MDIFLIFLILLCSKVGSAAVNITRTRFLKDADVITSNNNQFQLGFFSPGNSTSRYVGIWYKTAPDEVVWVANRDSPLKDFCGVFKVSEDGNLQVLDGQNSVFWSSNISQTNPSNTLAAQLLDTGDLVLLPNIGGGTIWQNFDHPSDTLLPGMALGIVHDNAYNRAQVLRSWKSPSDPSNGRFTLGLAPNRKLTENFVYDNGRPHWRSGPWNGAFFIGVPSFYYSGQVHRSTVELDSEGWPIRMYFLSNDENIVQRYVLGYNGLVQHKVWNPSDDKWEVTSKNMDSDCDVYGKCGAFATCNPKNSPICSCLHGFEPVNDQEWRNGNWTSGCSRRTPLQCGPTGTSDVFLKLPNVKVPDYMLQLASSDEEDCHMQCQAQCSCLAYAYYLGIKCMTWNQTLIDIQEFNVTAIDLFIRLARSEVSGESRPKAILIAVVITGTITVAIVTFFIWRWMHRKRAGSEAKKRDMFERTSTSELIVNNVELKDLPLFKLEKLAVATKYFHLSNKLGEGGFGPVFKGKLEDGQEIAVKRLSRASGQGLQEFVNEVRLISKLQHRNLVRLLGSCIDGEEKLLVYEYMPNKSLDALLFDPVQRELLNWKTRFNIIEGICRGLLYLHRDSRLRIIHRDLKPSNILLDEDLNPKISDFGMAKIFGRKQDQGNTSRVVGTYGYMPPEYAMEGRFSEKSDVYSFGVLLLEIVSGRRNGSFTDHDESLSLLAYVWKLWNEGNVTQLIDPIMGKPWVQEEIFQCIHIGLLCVQEFPENRPTISAVISMLDGENLDLPKPMQPGFTQRRNYIQANGASHCSTNHISVTFLDGR